MLELLVFRRVIVLWQVVVDIIKHGLQGIISMTITIIVKTHFNHGSVLINTYRGMEVVG
jgi:hypothetical protein